MATFAASQPISVNTRCAINYAGVPLNDDKSIWELKEQAKWSNNPQERKDAITNLSARGAEALPSLDEIMSVTAYDDIRAACIEAIRSLKKGTAEESKPETKLADLPP
jgi:hypothetical protein